MTGPVIPGNLPARTDRLPSNAHTFLSTDSGPMTFIPVRTPTRQGAELTLPLDHWNRFSNSRS